MAIGFGPLPMQKRHGRSISFTCVPVQTHQCSRERSNSRRRSYICRMSKNKGNRIARINEHRINEHGRELLGLGSRNRISSSLSSIDRDPTQHDPHAVARLTEGMSLAMERAQRAEEAALRAEMRNEELLRRLSSIESRLPPPTSSASRLDFEDCYVPDPLE